MAKASNANLPEYAFSIGMPFKDIATNETLGVLLLDISKQWMRDTLQDTQISQNGGYMLALCSSGNVILPSEWENKMKLTPDKTLSLSRKYWNHKQQEKQMVLFTLHLPASSFDYILTGS